MKLKEGEKAPFGYALSYHDFLRNYVMVYPLGIHLLVRWCRNIWHFVIFKYKPTKVDELMDKAFINGYNSAYEKYIRGKII